MSEPQYIHRYDHHTGLRKEASVFAGFRYESEAGFRAGEVESYVMFLKDKQVHNLVMWSHAPLSGLYYSNAGRVYVASSDGAVHIYSSVSSDKPTRIDELGLAMPALFALDDQHVYAYGGAPGAGRVCFFDGTKWTELPPPPAWLIHVHGCAPDCIYAAAQGAVYLWNGTTWRQVLGAQQVFSSVYVVSPNQIYAVGRSGLLFEGSADGFIERARWDGPLVGVAKFRDELWFGAEEAGILKLPQSSRQIEVVRAELAARYLDAREDLLFVVETTPGSTSDGVTFTGGAKGALEKMAKRAAFLA